MVILVVARHSGCWRICVGACTQRFVGGGLQADLGQELESEVAEQRSRAEAAETRASELEMAADAAMASWEEERCGTLVQYFTYMCFRMGGS